MFAEAVLTVSESKRLIAKGVAAAGFVRLASKEGTLAVGSGTTNGYVVEEITGDTFDKKTFVTGKTLPAGYDGPKLSYTHPDLVIRKGKRLDIKASEAIADMGPGDVYFFFDRGWVYWEMGETELAMADWDAAIEWEPDNPWNWSDRGWRFLDIGEYQLALDDFNQAIELDPETGWHYGNRAWAYWNMGEGDLALANMSRAIELSPDSAWRWHDRGNLYVEMGDFHAALEDFDRAISLGAQDSWFYSDRAWLFWEHLGEPELAIADWMAAIEMDPEQPWHYWDRAWAYSDLGDWDAARPDFEEFLRLTEHESEEYANDRTEAQNWLANN